MFEEEVEILLRGLKGQLVQQLLGRRGLGGESEEGIKQKGRVKKKRRSRVSADDVVSLFIKKTKTKQTKHTQMHNQSTTA